MSIFLGICAAVLLFGMIGTRDQHERKMLTICFVAAMLAISALELLSKII